MALGGDQMAGEGEGTSCSCLQHFVLLALAGSNLQHLSIGPEAASCSSVVHAEDRAVNEIEMASIFMVLKIQQGRRN